ncbi:MAG: FHA domain-containing protein [Sphingobacteriales bacterium]|nr:MAG: FHA domain-containing protein [Sphingobacteriales bacterium]
MWRNSLKSPNIADNLRKHTTTQQLYMEQKIARLLLFKDQQVIRRIAVKTEFKGSITIGRQGFGAVIDLPGSYISRKQAEIILSEDNRLLIRDLGSTGGTFVNGERIDEVILKNGDEIVFSTANDGYKLVIELLTPETGIEPVSATGNITGTTKKPALPKGMTVSGRDTSDIAKLLENKAEITIGRASDADICLPQLTITRKHAVIKKYQNGKITITDLESKNGTFVNGKRITYETDLTPNDDIFIGNYKFRLTKPAEDIRKQNAIVADALTRKVNRGNTVILHDVKFRIPSQEFVAVMGPSGCGKSTLLRALNGDAPATTGKVTIHGLDLYNNYDYLKRMIGYVPQDDIVHHELSVEQSLFYAAKLRLSGDVSAEDIRQKITEVLTNLNINDPEIRNRRVGELSGGQRKRVSIAVELLTDPSILFLDEPTSPLDPETIEDFLLCVKSLTQKGTTVLMVTHKPDDLYYVDKVIFLSKGGYLTYYGSKENYLDYFEAKNVIEVYAKNGTQEQGMIWAGKLRGMYPLSGEVHRPNNDVDKVRDESFFKQLFWLTVRYFNIRTNDRLNTTILLAQALVIAGLVALIFKELELSVLFLMSISAIWFGTNNAAKEIVGELPVYRRERMFNLKIMPYIFSKVFVLSCFSILQVLAFVAIVYVAVGNNALHLNHYWGYVGVMFYLTFSATLLGLLVSALVNNQEKVMTIIPIVLIPQIILSGVITAIPEETPAEVVSYGMLSRWGTESFAYVQDSIRSYMADPQNPSELVYQTVDAVDFLNLPKAYIHEVIGCLPDSLLLPRGLDANLWIITVINLFVFIALFVAMKRKDSV